MTLLDRHIEFVEALRSTGLPVSLAEGLDAVGAIEALGISERETLRTSYAATLVKRQSHRPAFDLVFDLYFPALIGDGHDPADGIVRDETVADEPMNNGNVSDYPVPTAPRPSPTSARHSPPRWRWATRTRCRCWPGRRCSGSG